jgi:hypothetical protein
MKRYQKADEEPIDAVQFNGSNHEEIINFIGSGYLLLYSGVMLDSNAMLIPMEMCGGIVEGDYIVRSDEGNVCLLLSKRMFESVYKYKENTDE